jgi:hypothetical protein
MATQHDSGDSPMPAELPFLNSNIDKLDKSPIAYIRKYHSRRFTLFITLDIVLTIGLVFLSLATSSSTSRSSPILAAFFMPSLFILGPLMISVQREMDKRFAISFADIMGYVYAPTAPLATFTGMLFKLWTDQCIMNVMLGTCHGHAIRLFDYSFRRPQGKSSVECSYTVLEVQFEKDLPTIETIHRQANLLEPSNFSMASNDLYHNQTLLKTEGNFNDYFSVFVPRGTEIEGLEVVTPDLMAAMLDRYRNFDFECNGHNLYIFMAGEIRLRTKKDFLQIYSLADALIPKLHEMISA